MAWRSSMAPDRSMARRAASDRRVDHAVDRVRQPERANDYDGGKAGRPTTRPGALGAVGGGGVDSSGLAQPTALGRGLTANHLDR